MELIKSKVINQGLCCDSCQEEVNVHRCSVCEQGFVEGEIIHCKNHSHSDCEHYHDGCKPDDELKCEDCGDKKVTHKCNKGSHLCSTCAGTHRRDGHNTQRFP